MHRTHESGWNCVADLGHTGDVAHDDTAEYCTCVELIHEYKRLGKAVSSSCQVHEWDQTNARNGLAVIELQKFRNELIAASYHAFAERLQFIISALDPASTTPPLLRVGAKGSWSWYRDLPGPIHLVVATTLLCLDAPIAEQTTDGYWNLKWTDCADLSTCAACIESIRKS